MIVLDNFISPDGVDTGKFENGMRAESYGLEVSANWFVSDSWRIQASYSWLHLDAHLDQDIDTSDYAYDPATETRDPEHNLSLRSSFDLGHDVDLDVWMKYVSELEQYSENALGSGIDDHFDLDLQVAWKASRDIELSLSGRNLLESSHSEFGQEPLQLYFRNSVPRSFYAQLKWSF